MKTVYVIIIVILLIIIMCGRDRKESNENNWKRKGPYSMNGS